MGTLFEIHFLVYVLWYILDVLYMLVEVYLLRYIDVAFLGLLVYGVWHDMVYDWYMIWC